MYPRYWNISNSHLTFMRSTNSKLIRIMEIFIIRWIIFIDTSNIKDVDDFSRQSLHAFQNKKVILIIWQINLHNFFHLKFHFIFKRLITKFTFQSFPIKWNNSIPDENLSFRIDPLFETWNVYQSNCASTVARANQGIRLPIFGI